MTRFLSVLAVLGALTFFADTAQAGHCPGYGGYGYGGYGGYGGGYHSGYWRPSFRFHRRARYPHYHSHFRGRRHCGGFYFGFGY